MAIGAIVSGAGVASDRLLWGAAFVPIYFLPTLLSIFNRNSCVLTIGLINAAYGWTLVGWYIVFAAALVDWKWRWACDSSAPDDRLPA